MVIGKYSKVLCFAMMFLFIGLSNSSCSGEDINEYDDFNSQNNNEGTNDPTYELIKRNISATVYYSDYSWNINVKSKLATAFPNKSIIYGHECGHGVYRYYQHFTSIKEEYLQRNDGNGNIYVCVPTFAEDEYARERLYWKSYKALKAKAENGEKLTSDEQNFYGELTNLMNKCEYQAKNSYSGRLYVQFDNKRYYYYCFGVLPYSYDN